MAAAPRAAGVAVAVALRTARGAGTRARGWRVPGIRAACLALARSPRAAPTAIGTAGTTTGPGRTGERGTPAAVRWAASDDPGHPAAWPAAGGLAGAPDRGSRAGQDSPGLAPRAPGTAGAPGAPGAPGLAAGLARRSLAWTAAARRSPAGRDPCGRCSPGRRTPGPRRSGRSRPRGGPCGWVACDRVARGPAARTAGWAGPSPPADSPLAGAPGRLPCRDGAGRWSRAARWRRCCSRPRPGPGPRGPRGRNRGSSAGRTALAARADRRSAGRYPAGTARGPPGQGSPVCCR